MAAALVAAGADASGLIAEARERFDAALVAESSADAVIAELKRELRGVA